MHAVICIKKSAFFLFFVMLLISVESHAAFIAITMDDPNLAPTPLMSPLMRDKAILHAITKNHLKIILFVHGEWVNSQSGDALLQRWSRAGQLLGNHTYTHVSLDDVSLACFENDFIRNKQLLSHYPAVVNYFRFPYLKEGDTLKKRDGFRAFLKSQHEALGSVTIDASDWYISQRLEERLKLNPRANLQPYKQYYLHHIWNRAQYYDHLAFAVTGRHPSHILLIHHNLLNALFFDDLIKMFKQHGWVFVNANVAYQDPIFKQVLNTLPAGESLVWGLAKSTGKYDRVLRYPGEDGEYEAPAMTRLGL